MDFRVKTNMYECFKALISFCVLNDVIPSFCCSGDWMCTFCRSLRNPEMEYNCDDDPPSEKDMSETEMSPEDQRVSHTEKQSYSLNESTIGST